MLNRLIHYFDLQSASRRDRPLVATDMPLKSASTTTDTSLQPDEHKKHAPIVPQYLAFSAGVIIEPLLSQYIASNAWPNLDDIWGRVVFGLLMGLVLLPGVYKATFSPEKPVSIQVLALIQIGLGWQTLLEAGIKIAT